MTEQPQPTPRKANWYCHNCGADNPESWSYCRVCLEPKEQRKQA